MSVPKLSVRVRLAASVNCPVRSLLEQARRALARAAEEPARGMLCEPLERRVMLSTAALWHFDQTGGTSAVDASGNNNTAILQGGATIAAGYNGNALSLNGASATAVAADSPSLDPTSQITVSAWINATDWNGAARIVEKADPGTDDQYALLAQNGQLEFSLYGVGNVSAALPSAGTWHNVVGTFDGSTMSLYVDGQMVSSAYDVGSLRATAGPLVIGGQPGGGTAGSWFHGMVDEVEVDDAAEGSSQISAQTSGPVGHWEFNDGAGSTTASDSSGSGNTGTLIGTPTWSNGVNGMGGLAFDGQDQYVSVPDSTSLNPTTQITVSAWINAADWNGNRRIVQKGDPAGANGGDNQYRLSAQSGQLAFALYGIGSVSAPLPSTGQWHQVAGTYDGSTIRLYVDGQPLASAAASGSVAVTSGPLEIGNGADSTTPGDSFKGTISDVQVYSRALTAADLAGTCLPRGWSAGDIGSPLIAGGAAFDGSTWQLSGAGSGIGAGTDQFNFARQSLAGDGSVVAQLTSLSSNSAQAGIMLRDDDSPNSAFAAVLFGSGAVSFQWRSAPGGSAQSVALTGIAGSGWLKLTRSGDSVAAFYSADGNSWTQVGSRQSVNFALDVQAGIAVSSAAPASVASASFTNVSVLPGTWSAMNIGSPSLPGYATSDGSNWTASGVGSGVAGTSDQFNFVSTSLTGDGSLVAEVESTSAATGMAGLMYRNDGSSSSAFAAVAVAANGAITFQWRNAGDSTVSTSNTYWNSSPVWLKLSRTGDVFTASYSPDGTTWTQIDSPETVTLGATSLAGLAVAASPSAGGVAALASFRQVSLLPPQWSDGDVGRLGVQGQSTFDGTTWFVSGSGSQESATTDELHFASTTLSGDGVVAARVLGLTAPATGSAGVMIRNGSAADAAFAAVLDTAQGVRFQWRNADGASFQSTVVAGVAGPVWVKLSRSGNTFSAFDSTDGSNWAQIGSAESITMASYALAGIASSSGNNLFLGTGLVDSVSVTNTGPAAPPTDLQAQPVSLTEISLTWRDDTEDAASFIIMQSTDGQGFTTVGTLPTGNNSFVVTGLSTSHTYTFKVQAVDAMGTSAPSNPVTVAPQSPGYFDANVYSGTDLLLTWLPAWAGQSGYQIQQSTDGQNFTTITTLGSDITAYYVSGLTPSTTYTFRITAIEGGQLGTSSVTTMATTGATDTTGYYQVTGVSGLELGNYQYYQASGSLSIANGGWVPAASPQGAILHVLTGSVSTSAGVSYQFGSSGAFQISPDGIGFNDSYGLGPSLGYMNYENYIFNVTLQRQGQITATPTLLVTTAAPDGTINLVWPDQTAGQAQFEIDRSSDGQNFTNLTTVGPGVSQYNDGGLQSFTQYYYRVRPIEGSTDGDYSNVSSATTAPQGVSYAPVDTVTVQIDGSTTFSHITLDRGASYELQASGLFVMAGLNAGAFNADSEYGLNGAGGTQPELQSSWPNHINYGIGVNDSALSTNKSPYWGSYNPSHIYTINVIGNGQPLSLDYHDDYYPDNHYYGGQALEQVQIYKAVPVAPTSLTATPEPSQSGIVLNWQYSGDAREGFQIERSTDGTNFTPLGPPVAAGGNSFTDTTAAAGITYFYRVYATGPLGDSGYSNVAEAMWNGSAPYFVSTPPTAFTTYTTLGPSVTNVRLPAADPTLASISGQVFYDANSNGTRDHLTVDGTTIQLAQHGDTPIMSPNDDSSTDALPLGFTMDLFGTNYNQFYINNNGNVTFGGPVGAFTPTGFPNRQAYPNPMIAPFWADVDTRGGYGNVYFTHGINAAGRHFVQVDWENVGYYQVHGDKLNDFSLYIEDDPDGPTVAFFYRSMQWTTGDASNGVNGFGAAGAQIGFDAEDGTHYMDDGRPSSAADVAALSNTVRVYKITPTGYPVQYTEPGADGVTVQLLDASDNVVASQISHSADQDGNGLIDPITEQGLFEFDNLPAGTYTVAEQPAAPWNQTFPSSGTYSVTLAAGQHVDSVLFGDDRRVIYTARAIDPLGNPLTYTLVDFPTGAKWDGNTNTVTWLPTGPGTYHFEIDVSDGQGGTAAQAFDVTVNTADPEVNPSIASVPQLHGVQGVPYVYRLVAVDPNPGDVLSYQLLQWPPGMTLDPTSHELQWTPTSQSPATVEVEVTDGHGGAATQQFTITVDPPVTYLPPDVTAIPDQQILPGQEFDYVVQATDPQNGADGLSYDLVGPVPTGMQMQQVTGEIFGWTPGAADVGSSRTITVRVTDQQGMSATTSFKLVVLPPVPAAPTGLTGTLVGGDAVLLKWDAVTDPYLAGYNVYRLNSDTQQFDLLTPSPITSTTFTDHDPPRGVDSYYFVTTVNTAAEESQPAQCGPITVPNAGPSIVSAGAEPSPVDGTTATLDTSAVDSTAGAVLTYNWVESAGPAAADLASSNGTSAADALPVTFHAAGDYTFALIVSDPQGLTAQESISVTVAPTLTAVLVVPGSANVTPDGSLQFAATATDQFGSSLAVQPSFTWAVSGGGAIDASGTFTAGSTPSGPFTISATASDGTDAVSGSARVSVVTAGQGPVINSVSASPQTVTGTSTSLSVSATDPAGTSSLTYTWALAAKPTGVADPTFSDNNDNSASSAVATFTAAGNYVLSVTATDSAGDSAVAFVSVTVAQTLAALGVSPSAVAVHDGDTLTFHAIGLDQFGNPMQVTPQWSVDTGGAGGSVNASSGTYTAPASTGSDTVRATVGAATASARVTVGLAPSAPSNVTAVAVSTSQIQIEWDPDPAAYGFIILRTNPDGTTTTLPAPDQVTNSDPYYDQSLPANTAYQYSVEATDQQGNVSAASPAVSARTWALPPTPTGLVGTALSGTQVELTWNDGRTVDPQITGWLVLRATSSDPNTPPAQSSFSSVLNTGESLAAPYFYDQSATPNTQYWYEVVAVKHSTEQSAPAQIAVKTNDFVGVPIAPTGLQAGYAGEGRVGLRWNPVQTDGLLGYDIYRSTDPNFIPSASTLVGSSADPRYTDDGVPQDTWYYVVKAVVNGNTGGEEISSLPSASAVVNTQDSGSNPTAPNAPSNPQATAGSYQVALTWHDNSINEAGFTIYREQPGDAAFQAVGRVTQDQTTFTDTTVVPSSTYVYEIAAYSIRGGNTEVDSPPTPQVTVRTQDVGPAPNPPQSLIVDAGQTTYQQIALSWQRPGTGPAISGFDVYRSTDGQNFTLLTQQELDQTQTTFTDNGTDNRGLNAGTTYYYQVVCVTADNHPSAPASISWTTPSNPNKPPIASFTSSDPSLSGAMWDVTGQTKLSALVVDPDGVGGSAGLTGWSLVLHPLDATANEPDLSLASGTEPVGSLETGGALVFTLDPSQYLSGAYDLILTATDASGNTTTATQAVKIDSQLKLGNFTLPVTDMTVPVPGGQSVSVTRVYDSQQAGTDTNIGYGWHIEFVNGNLRTTAQAADDQPNLTLRVGDTVYVTLPGGQAHSFTFFPKPIGYRSGSALGPYDPGAGFEYYPNFVANDGSTAQLTVEQDILSYDGDTFSGYDPQNAGVAYNPASGVFGGYYQLTTADGTQYNINASTGQINSIADRNGNTLTYGSGGVTYNGQPLVTFTTGANGQIATVQGPTQTLQYGYDAQGNLTSVTDAATNAATTYTYGDPTHSHYLTGVTDPLGVTTVTVSYDPSSGKLASLQDASGNTAPIGTGGFDGSQATQSVTDLSGSKTEDVYDQYGDVIRHIQAITDASGAVVRYLVTVHQFSYTQAATSDDDVNAAILDGTLFSGHLASQTDWQPFSVPGTDPNGLRYSENPTTPAQQTDYYILDQSDPTRIPASDLWMPADQITYGADGTPKTTTFSGYVDGKPSYVTDPFGNVIYNAFDSGGNLISTTTDRGTPSAETTYYTYTTTGSGIPAGLPLKTYQLRPNAGGGTREVDQAQNTYYGPSSSSSAYVVPTSNPVLYGMLASSTDVSGVTTYFTYNANGTADATYHKWVDPANSANIVWVWSENIYDNDGRVSATNSGQYQSVANGVPSGLIGYLKQSYTTFNPAGQVIETGNKYFDANGNLVETLNQVTSEYDSEGRVIQTTNADGTQTRTVYDAMGRPVWQTDTFDPNSPNAVLGTETIYDSLGRAVQTLRYTNVNITITADPSHAGVYVAKLTVPPANDLISSITTFYTDLGQVDHMVGTDGQTTQYTYYPNGQQHTITRAAGTPQATTTTYVYHDAPTPGDSGNWSLVQDGRGFWTRTDFDGHGRAIKITYDVNADGSIPTGAASTTTVYGLYGTHVTQTDAAGQSTDNFYDDAGNLVQVVQPPADPTQPSVRNAWNYTYDAAGDETGQVDPRSGITNAQWNPTGATIEATFAYNAVGQELSHTLPDGQTESWSYDALGRTKTHTDFDGQVTVYVYDDDPTLPSGQRTMLGRVAEVDYFTTSAEYQQTPSTPNQQTVYGYDDLGRQNVVMEYAGGQLMRTETSTFDAATGQLASLATPEGTVHYVYDPATGRQIETWTGTSYAAATTDTLYGYDALGRLASVTQAIVDGQAIGTTLPTTRYTYDLDGNLLSTVLPNGLTTADTYNGLNQLTEVKTTTASAGLVADYQYTVRADGTRTGLLEKILNPDNATYATTQVIWAYDGLDRLIKETYDVNADGVGQAGSVAEGDYIDAYAYDPAGNRLSKSHDAGGNGSLTADAGDAVTLYRYGTVDGNGNLQLASGDNRLTWEQTTTGGSTPVTTTTVYGYDANGSLTTKSVTTAQSGTNSTVQDVYHYDLKGQLVLATPDGTTTSYAYDSAGNPVSSASGGKTTTNLIDRQNPTGYSQTLEQHVNGSSRASTTYLVGLSMITQTDGTGTTTYLLADGQGSTRQIATSSGTVTAVYNYDAFGNAIGFNAATASTQVLYTGQQFEGGIGEYDLRARNYDPAEGRFLTQDTLSPSPGDLLNANLYIYAAGNSPNFMDPSGHSLEELAVAMIGLSLDARDALVSAPIFNTTVQIASWVIANQAEILAYSTLGLLLTGATADWVGNYIGKLRSNPQPFTGNNGGRPLMEKIAGMQGADKYEGADVTIPNGGKTDVISLGSYAGNDPQRLLNVIQGKVDKIATNRGFGLTGGGQGIPAGDVGQKVVIVGIRESYASLLENETVIEGLDNIRAAAQNVKTFVVPIENWLEEGGE